MTVPQTRRLRPFQSEQSNADRRQSYGPRGILRWSRYQVEEVAKSAITAGQQIAVGISAGAGIIGGSDNPLRTGIVYSAAMLVSGIALGSLSYFSKKREGRNKELFEADTKAASKPEIDESKKLAESNEFLRFENGYLKGELTKAGSSNALLEQSNENLASANNQLHQQNERLLTMLEQAVEGSATASAALAAQQNSTQSQPQIGSARALEDRRGRGRSAGGSQPGRRI